MKSALKDKLQSHWLMTPSSNRASLEFQGHRDRPSPPCSLAAQWWHMITHSRRYQDMVSEMKQLAALATEQELSVEERK